jgi:hypothetical protein
MNAVEKLDVISNTHRPQPSFHQGNMSWTQWFNGMDPSDDSYTSERYQGVLVSVTNNQTGETWQMNRS